MLARTFYFLILSLVLVESRWHRKHDVDFSTKTLVKEEATTLEAKHDEHVNNSLALSPSAEESESWEAERGKRGQAQRIWTAEDRESFNQHHDAQLPRLEHSNNYELEVREAQNSSLCNYTITAIPNPGGRIPRDLVHVRCNNIGSRCLDKGTYCYTQLYRNVEVLYENGRNETLKVYSGCVCSLQIYGSLEPYIPEIDLDQ